MYFSGLVMALMVAAGASSPLADAGVKRQDSGSYTVPGLGARKQAIIDAGGNTLDLAIAMLETENMQTNYAYGMNNNDMSIALTLTRV